ncbi:hypothetical protein [Furfurilactobacillus curtus]|uniref:Uncharacterized protein n=1 Tax=Furfurilactobacillus curtus TaxID=1746200 RepID=A0ABQ5JNQ5_9LACO
MVETLVVLSVTLLIVGFGMLKFHTSRQIQTERTFISATLALVERAKSQATRREVTVIISFDKHFVWYREGAKTPVAKLVIPQTLQLIQGRRIVLAGSRMVTPTSLIFLSTRRIEYTLKPQLGWGVIHVTETAVS